MNIRTARTGDLQRIVEIDPQAAVSAQRLDFLSRAIEAGSCYVAEKDESIVGYVVLNYTFFGNGFIPLIAVEESLRGTGIGTALMMDAAGRCRTRKLFTSVHLPNLPMHVLLKSLDYEVTGIVHGLHEDSPEVFYVKEL